MRQEKLYRNKRCGQAIVEYITLFLVVLALFATFLNSVRGSLQSYHNTMVNRIATQ